MLNHKGMPGVLASLVVSFHILERPQVDMKFGPRYVASMVLIGCVFFGAPWVYQVDVHLSKTGEMMERAGALGLTCLTKK